MDSSAPARNCIHALHDEQHGFVDPKRSTAGLCRSGCNLPGCWGFNIKPPGSWKFDMSPESLDYIRLHGKLGPGSVDVCRFNIEKSKGKGLWQTLSCFIGKTFTC